MHHKVKSEQCSVTTGSEKVGVFQASLKLVIGETGAKSLLQEQYRYNIKKIKMLMWRSIPQIKMMH